MLTKLATYKKSYLTLVEDQVEEYKSKDFANGLSVDVCCSQNVKDCCDQLECSREQLFYCIISVGKNMKTIEVFWSMNKDRLRKQLGD